RQRRPFRRRIPVRPLHTSCTFTRQSRCQSESFSAAVVHPQMTQIHADFYLRHLCHLRIFFRRFHEHFTPTASPCAAANAVGRHRLADEHQIISHHSPAWLRLSG